mmetsp:Transcript_20719/g.23653  ORF Transcript_20719/g.23653 Transcript_20719/m.23653 type:complete len:476 (-) Transcript_20719:54-1481(-)
MRFYRKLSTASFLLLGTSKPCYCFTNTGITKLAARRIIPYRTISITTNNLHAIKEEETTTTSGKKDVVLKTTSDLTNSIREAWKNGETDGVLKLSKDFRIMEQFSIVDIIESTLASVPTKSSVASIMNSWIGSCCYYPSDDTDLGAEYAYDLLTAYDTMLEDFIEPDLVTLCLVYSALMQANNTDYHTLAKEEVLERARWLAKKEGGTKWRKSVVRSKRKTTQLATDVFDEDNSYGIRVLYESDDELIVSKPSGMACFHKKMTTSGKLTKSRRKRKTQKKATTEEEVDIALETALLNNAIPLSCLNAQARGIVHRLDRGTSGCMILAKTDERHAQLTTQFFLRRVEKSYDALVVASKILEEKTGEITIPVYSRPALSYYSVIQEYTGLYHLRLQTKTGRKHQVRVHCAKGLGLPVLNDFMYVDDEDAPVDESNTRFCLHASTLRVPGIPIEIESPIPNWWKEEIQQHQPMKEEEE